MQQPGKSIKGFDPRFMACALYSTESADASRKNDISRMIAVSIERGNTVSKMDKNSLPSFVIIIKRLIAVYGLVDKAGSDPRALTLSRVAECFPHLTCSYCMSVAKK